MYKKNFEIRWSDVDANGHLANSAYTNFMSHTRMSCFVDYGFTFQHMKKFGIGPVVFYEHMYYFKEAFMNEPITVSLELKGLSEDGTFFQFDHNFYNSKGENLAYCDMFGGFIDLKTRKLTALTEELISLAQNFPKSKDYKTLTKEDTRKHGERPINLS